MRTLSGINIPVRTTDPPAPEQGIEVYSKNGIVYSIDSSGLIEVLTNVGSGGGSGGSSDHIDIPFDAGQNLLAFKLITLNEQGHAVYASADNLNHVNKLIGVSKSAAQLGHKVVVRNKGVLTNTGWNFIPNQLLYLGLDGDITTNPNLSLFSNNIGYVVSTTSIFINIGRSIIRG